MLTVAKLVLVGSVSVAAVICCTPASAEGTISVDNRSESKIKVVGEGGSAVVGVGVDPVEVSFTGGEGVGIDVKVWWVAKPRELCQLFVPWQRIVVVSGKSQIRCRSQ
jgi:hypothetical protein